MQKRNIFLAIAAIIFGVLIFTFSLFIATQQSNSRDYRLSSAKFYLNSKILPDHLFYPFLMLVDRGLIALTSGESEVFLRIRLAQDRMIAAQKLLEKGEESLALSTLTKSQKYLILAAQEFMLLENPSTELKSGLIEAFKENTLNLENSQKMFKTIPTGPLGDLVVESQTLIVVLENHIQD
jgi:hypothetical protein